MDKKNVIALLRSLLISKNGSYELGELMKDFREEAGCPVPRFGYKTSLDFLKSIPDAIQLIHGHHKTMVKAVENSKSAHIVSLLQRQKLHNRRQSPGSTFYSKMYYDTTVPNGSTESCKSKVPKKFDNSICAAAGDNNIETEIKNSNTSLVKRKEGQFICVGNEYEVGHEEVESSYRKYSDCHEHNIESGIKTSKNEGKQMEICIFEDIVTDLHKIPKLNLESFAEIGKYVEVCIPVICNPHTFTIQLRKFKIKLFNLMLEIQMFYNKNGERYIIPDSLIKCSQLCIVLTKTTSKNSQWYRAVVLECTDKHKVVVGLIDYGIIEETDISTICYMHSQFGKLPPQALSGHLANIRPYSGTVWSEESIERFLNLVFERDLVAGIVDVDCKEMWLSVALSFADGTDLHISDTLVEENLAIFGPSVSDTQKSVPWIGNKAFPMISIIPKYRFYPKDRGQSQNETFEKKRHFEENTNILSFSYSESNDRLLEMFRTC